LSGTLAAAVVAAAGGSWSAVGHVSEPGGELIWRSGRRACGRGACAVASADGELGGGRLGRTGVRAPGAAGASPGRTGCISVVVAARRGIWRWSSAGAGGKTRVLPGMCEVRGATGGRCDCGESMTWLDDGDEVAADVEVAEAGFMGRRACGGAGGRTCCAVPASEVECSVRVRTGGRGAPPSIG
jgi:hypothetical protein